MAHTQKEEPNVTTTLAELIEETTYRPGRQKPPCCPPALDPALQLKWGLALLGEEKAKEYLAWIQARFCAESH